MYYILHTTNYTREETETNCCTLLQTAVYNKHISNNASYLLLQIFGILRHMLKICQFYYFYNFMLNLLVVFSLVFVKTDKKIFQICIWSGRTVKALQIILVSGYAVAILNTTLGMFISMLYLFFPCL